MCQPCSVVRCLTHWTQDAIWKEYILHHPGGVLCALTKFLCECSCSISCRLTDPAFAGTRARSTWCFEALGDVEVPESLHKVDELGDSRAFEARRNCLLLCEQEGILCALQMISNLPAPLRMNSRLICR